MKSIILSLTPETSLVQSLVKNLGFALGFVNHRQFPDGETYIRIDSSVADCDVIIVESLYQPDTAILPLLFLAKTARALGAKRVGLCAPYLAYMRQDKQFQPGEGVTSEYFAELISHYFDWMVTVDPHLHRHHALKEIYTIPTAVAQAAPLLAQWIKASVKKPVIVGPDAESEQWVQVVSKEAGVPYIILQKTRQGDESVSVAAVDMTRYQDHTPVLVDDIISSAHTMIEAQRLLQDNHLLPAVCIGVHAVFAPGAFELLRQSGVNQIVTCNTVEHSSNRIDCSGILIDAISTMTKDS